MYIVHAVHYTMCTHRGPVLEVDAYYKILEIATVFFLNFNFIFIFWHKVHVYAPSRAEFIDQSQLNN